MEYKVTETLTENEQMVDFDSQLLQGNHQTARRKPRELKKKLDRDVEYGFALPIDKEVVQHIPGSAVQPCNLDPQFTLMETGDRVEKD